MANPLKQENRLMSVKTPLGPDVLCIDRASITERISHPFSMQLEFLADLDKEPSIKHDQIVGKSVTLTVKLPGKGNPRHFNGMVSRFSKTGQDKAQTKGFAYYRAEVVPWLWLLTLTSDSKVFQPATIPEIIEKVFKEWQGKFSDLVNFENKCEGSFKKVDYCIQYRETDFNFVSRLMEQEGIFYFFKHADGKHTLVLGNSPSAFEACPELEKARYLPEAGMGEWEDGVSSWEHRHSMVPGKYVLADYHFMMSNKGRLEKPEDSAVKIGNNSSLEIFDYPGEFAQRFNKPDERMGEVETHAKDIVKWRMEEQAAAHLQISGNSTCRAFTTGSFFKLLGEKEAEIKVPGTQGKYVLMSVKHSFVQSPDYVSGTGVNQPYRNTFTCIPHEVPYRPARTTPRPVIQGLQSAKVVGKKGEEIDCDKYGRVKVQFYWDREGKEDENSSCWVRVASHWAGKQWGMVHIPRIGQEVIVAFLEGDPDQPLIVGSVYNYDNMPPYELDKNKTQSGIKSRSTKDGKEENFNEIRFEDKKDEEQIYIHAEKNCDIVVENDETHSVGFEKKDKGDQTIKVFNNQKLEVGTSECSDGSQTIKIWKDRTATLEQGNDKLQVKMGNRDAIIDMGNDGLTIKMGNQTTKLDLGKSETQAMQSIELKVGQSSLKVDQTGVTIKGMTITIDGTLMTDIKGMMTQVQASAILTAKGALTMIN